MILLEIKKLFEGLQNIFHLNNLQNTTSDMNIKICKDWERLFISMKDQKFYKIKNLNLKKQLLIEKIIHEIQINDIHYYLRKLDRFETTFKEYLFQTQTELKISDNDFTVEYIYNTSTYPSIYQIVENITDEYLMNNTIKNNSPIMIHINKKQQEWLENYYKINLYLINHRLNNLNQSKKFRLKEKKRICIAANEFMYDQEIVNELNNNYEKIEDKEIAEIFNCLYSEEIGTPEALSECPDNQISSKIIEDKKLEDKSDLDNEIFCMKYDQRQHFSLIVMNNKNGNNTSEYLK